MDVVVGSNQKGYNVTLGFGPALALALTAAHCLVRPLFLLLSTNQTPILCTYGCYNQLLQQRLLLQSSYYREWIREKPRGCVLLLIPDFALVQGERYKRVKIRVPVVACSSIYMRQLLCI